MYNVVVVVVVVVVEMIYLSKQKYIQIVIQSFQ